MKKFFVFQINSKKIVTKFVGVIELINFMGTQQFNLYKNISLTFRALLIKFI